MSFEFLQSPGVITVAGWITAILTLFIFSFLYMDNPLYKWAEHLFVGVSAGYGVVMIFFNVIQPNLIDRLYEYGGLIGSDFTMGHLGMFLVYLIFGIMGIMMLFKLSRQYNWVSRWPLAYVIGAFAGIQIIAYAQGDLILQIKATILPLWVPGDLLQTLSNWLIVFGVMTGIMYFFFSKKHTGTLGGVAKVGIWFLMISFGASFGYTVMGRISLAIGRFQDLLHYPRISSIVLLIMIVVLLVYQRMVRQKEVS